MGVPVFKTGEGEHLVLEGSIPFRLRHADRPPRANISSVLRLAAALVGGPETGQVVTTWEPEPEYFGTVRNTEAGKHYGQIPVGTYRITVERGGLGGAADVEVTEGGTATVTVTLR